MLDQNERPIVEVFKTNVKRTLDAHKIVAELHAQIPGSCANFDLGDCDKILRIELHELQLDVIHKTLIKNGYWCERL